MQLDTGSWNLDTPFAIQCEYVLLSCVCQGTSP
jgi:hypothetical protein